MKSTTRSGSVWALTDASGRLYDDVDTDQIYHNSFLHITDLREMGPHALGNLPGWQDFASRARPSDIVVAGHNFGAGSSRQHAVDCFISLGIGAIVAESFGAIYLRNAINSGFPVVRAPGLTDVSGRLRSGDRVTIDFGAGRLRTNRGLTLTVRPFSRVQMDIYLAGDLFAYGRLLDQGKGATPSTGGKRSEGGA